VTILITNPHLLRGGPENEAEKPFIYYKEEMETRQSFV
jgi:hypothetical protein